MIMLTFNKFLFQWCRNSCFTRLDQDGWDFW